MMQDEEYWDGIAPNENNYEVYYTQSPHQTQGAIGLPLAPNRRIHVPQPATIIIIDDDDGSTTGSSDVLNENNNIVSAPPTQDLSTIVRELANNGQTAMQGIITYVLNLTNL